MSLLPVGVSGGSVYEIPKSLRFRASASAYLSRTPGVAGNRRTWTWSGWVKRGALGSLQCIFSAWNASTNNDALNFTSADQLEFFLVDSGNLGTSYRVSTRVFRDPSAHYHILVAYSSPDATAQNRVRIWVNGDEITAWATNNTIAQNKDSLINFTNEHNLGRFRTGGHLDGYLSEINFIDGQALTPSSFGQTDANGVWQPKKYTGTYGTNGFYLPFNDGTNLTNLCLDRSGNGNNWTATNVSLTAGATYDWMDDTPSNNFAVLNAVHAGRSTLTNGNLTASGTTDLPTIIPESGTWYFERGGVLQTWTPPAAFPSGTGDYNFGQRPWQSTGPTGGQKSLCTKNLPVPVIQNPRQHFDVRTFTSNDSVNSITGLSFQPDFVWTKRRDQTYNHDLYDSVRGVNRRLQSNNTNAENTDPDTLTAFNSNGFTLGTNDNANNSPASGAAIAWAWKANGSAVTNTAGTITSQVSANTQAGFSIVTYTGTGANATVGHGLGVAPKLVIVKRRGGVGGSWFVWHTQLTGTQYLLMNTTDAVTSSAPTAWNSTVPSSTVFSIGTNASVNTNAETFVAYCFAEVPGFSRIGSYTGNGSADGPFVYCGFRPRWVMIKRTDTAGLNWSVVDSARNPSNLIDTALFPDLSTVEGTGGLQADFVSNGFKVRSTGIGSNANGGTYIFIALSETPFNYSRAR